MKRTLSGSRAQNAVDTPKVSYHGMRSLQSELEASPIPPEARKHVEYLSQFPPSQVCQWVEIWQRSKAQEYARTNHVNSCLHHRCSDLLEVEPDTWGVELVENVPVKTEQPHIGSRGGESMRSQFKVAYCPNLSLQGCMTSTSMVRNSLRKCTPEIYACSFCDKTFSRKGDWKRHEGSLHEPQKQWRCLEPGCNRKFTAKNKFLQHHKGDHRCENCKHDTNEAVISITQTASAWGCGFCSVLLLTWDDRANHIGLHYDTGSKKSDWDFSKVIQGLLCQPEVFDAWQSLLLRIHGLPKGDWPRFEWSMESSRELLRSLQSLQSVNSEQSAIDIAQSAYNLGLPTKPKDEVDTLLPKNGLYPFLEKAAAQEFLVDPLEPGDSLPTPPNTLIDRNGALQPGKAWNTSAMVAVDGANLCDMLLEGSHVVDEYLKNPKDYATPCAETFEPTAWFFWPDQNPLMD